MMGFQLRTAVLIVACGIVMCVRVPTPKIESMTTMESRTASLMSQILASVSSSSSGDDQSSLQNLCVMVNEIEASVLQMSSQEVADFDYAMAHLRSELSQTKENLTQIRLEYNATVSELRAHSESVGPLPKQLETAKSRETALLKQRELLSRECEQDVEGQRFRSDAVKTDMAVLDEALKHLSALKGVREPSPSFLEIEDSISEPTCTDPEITGPLVRCQNGYFLHLLESNGTISTFPPGNGMLYNQQLQCGFKIAPTGAGLLDRVELTFLGLHTVPDVDFVEVYDGDDVTESTLLGRYSGSQLPSRIRSKSPHMTVMFTTHNKQNVVSAFAASYKALRIPTTRSSAVNLCSSSHGETLTLTGVSGFLAEDARPEFAEATQHSAGTAYSKPLECSWLIHPLPGQGSQNVRLHFTFFNIEDGIDYVTVYDGDDSNSAVLLHATGSIIPRDVFSTTGRLFVTYHADYTVDGFGFHASWCVNNHTCPEEGQTPLLPEPKPLSRSQQFNESAPIPAQTVVSPQQIYVAPPDYPLPTPMPQTGSCCVNDCNRHGICNPVTCTCACYSGYTSLDCSITTESLSINSKLAGNNLLELASGMGSQLKSLIENGMEVQDECGDDVHNIDSSQVVQPLNLDPVTSLLERLKFELFRSLTYEHDTTNITKSRCDDELQQQDRDLQQLQQEVLMLGKLKSDMDARTKALTEKRDSLTLTMSSLQSYVTELITRIESSRSTRDSRETAQGEELKTLQSMRDLITHISGTTCVRDVKDSTGFRETMDSECYGELLPSELATQDPTDCKAICTFGCVGFTFHSHQGCRFFSAITEHSSGCAGDAAACSCFEKI